MADDIFNGTFDHAALDDEAINVIVNQLRKHPAIQQILSPIITEEDFKNRHFQGKVYTIKMHAQKYHKTAFLTLLHQSMRP
jgi:hypothetical protein